MSETGDLPPNDPEKANRELLSPLREPVEGTRYGQMWLIISQVVMALATLVLAVASFISISKTSEQITLTRISIEDNKNQFNQSQRPWVAATEFRITDVEIGKKPHVAMRVMNKGLTPAIMRTQLYVDFQRELPTDFSYPDDQRTSTAVLLPDFWALGAYNHPTEISEPIMAKLDSGELLLYAYGFSKYEDPRGNTYPPTHFCAFWDPKKKTQVLCPTHNTIK